MKKNSRFELVWLIGVGMIGSSLSLKLKEENLVDCICGIDLSVEHLDYALANKIIDLAFPSLTQISSAKSNYPNLSNDLANPNLIIVATPVKAMDSIFKQLRGKIPSECIIIDVGSTKENVIEYAQQQLSPEEFKSFVPCHPLTGRELNGPEVSNPRIFAEKKCLVLPHEQCNKLYLDRIVAMWTRLGSIVEQVDAKHHDDLLAATSHLPHYLSYMIVDLLTENVELADALNYTGGGFRDFSRTASSDPTMWTDIGIDNNKNLVKWMKKYIEVMKRYIDLLEKENYQEVHKLLSLSKESRDTNILGS